MPARPVAKRAFLAGLQCPAMGWHVHRAAADAVGPELAWIWYTGNQIQRTARAQLGPGVMLPAGSADTAVAATRQALADPESTLLFEATFTAAGCVARADALRRVDDGWELIEIKSSATRENGKVDEDVIDDIAYTAAVMRLAGVAPLRCTLMLVNREYRSGGTMPLMVAVDVTAETVARAGEVADAAEALAARIAQPERPDTVLIFACRDCAFYAGDCLGAGHDDSIFLIPRLLRQHFDRLRPHARLSELPPDPPLTPAQRRFLDIWRDNIPRTDAAGLQLLDAVEWPVAYLDFEAVQPGIPWFAGDKPYLVLPFQYSIHRRPAPGAALEHRQYLASAGTDWRRELAEQLLHDLGAQGSIVVYSSYEKTRLRSLGELFPDLEPAFDRVISRLFDLEKVILAGYQHPGFLGRSSIKRVLPVMVPELGYDQLAINDGMSAAAVFGLMQVGEYASDRHAVYREQLLTYCALDTLAMVRVHEALQEVRRQTG